MTKSENIITPKSFLERGVAEVIVKKEFQKLLENTKQALLPLIVTIFLSSFVGWSLGISKNSCNPYFEQNMDKLN